ncbi:hypothetical protein GGQ88_001963 [Novosphingobium hassiacum]|uniref:Uncharacterized protein n=1 Tax=Novosphingobium hassiacum TaxID=173676 RepID=A0A7W5ZWS7_9SPHN|nr:hypothetical protein [Novosphingobium hassiacum]MBB3860694.1 hypothetical protein [Novosphingobium hassiacum]
MSQRNLLQPVEQAIFLDSSPTSMVCRRCNVCAAQRFESSSPFTRKNGVPAKSQQACKHIRRKQGSSLAAMS